MKRCIMCGNLGDENSTVCEVCGSQLQEVPETASNVEEKVSAPEQAQKQGDKTPDQAAAKAPARGVQDPARRPRRTKSGPQIYGQGDGMPNAEAMYGQQGVIRRDVQGRDGQRPVRTAGGAPAGRPNGGNAPAGRPNGGNIPAGRPNGGNIPAGRPNGGNAPAGRPNGGNAPAGRPNGGNAPAGRPNGGNAPTGRPNGGNAPAGRPMGVNGAPEGYPMNMQGRPSGNGPMVHPGRRMEAARAALKSPLFILIALLNTVCLAGAVAAIFMDQMNYSQLIRLISDINMPAQLGSYMDSVTTLLSKLDSGMIAANLVLHIPDLLLCIGLWLVCITVRTADEEMSGIGFLLMKIFVIINMIITCLVLLVCLVLSVTLVVAAWVSGTKSLLIMTAVMLVCMIIIAMAAIMYYFCYLATIKVCRLNAAAGEPYGQASAYVAVVYVILGLTGIVGLLSGIVNAEISNIVGSVGQIGWMILFAVWIFMYRGKMSEFED